MRAQFTFKPGQIYFNTATLGPMSLAANTTSPPTSIISRPSSRLLCSCDNTMAGPQATMRSAMYGTTGTLGLVCGAIATLLFLSNFGYFLRKHVRFLERVGTLRLWLDWHIASAFIGCGYVALHANVEMRNWSVRACV